MKTTANPGRALKALRIKRRWTLAKVSERTGLPVSTLSKIENGRTSLSYDKLARISKGLEIDIGALFAEPVVTASPAELVTGRRSITTGSARSRAASIFANAAWPPALRATTM